MPTHDYHLDNQSGSDFRADLNNALAAIVTVNSNATEPSTTFAHQLWVDTANNVLKIRNASNSAFITTGVSITTSNTFTGDLTGDVTGNLTGNVTGNLTGNVTGNVTGDLTGNVTGNVTGSVTGNADTATTLATARTINGISFDGSANISFNTDSVAEGSSNLYYTDARVQAVSINNVVEDTTPQLGGDLASNGNDILFADSDKAIFGSGSDLKIYHDGSNSYIDDAGTGSLIIRSNGTDISLVDAASNNMISAKTSAEVELYHNSQKKLATSSTGVDVTGNITASGQIIGSLSGNASTSTALATARTISLSGDVAGSASFDGTSDITITSTIQANSIALGTDTVGNYVQTITGTANKVSVSGSGSESANITLTLPDDVQIADSLTVAGNLTVNGTLTSLDTTNLDIADNLFQLNAGLTGSPVNDSGMLINRGNQNNGIFMWDESVDKFTLGLTTADGTSTGNITLSSLGTLVANVEGNVTGAVTGTVSSLSNHDTDDLTEGSNLYYTQGRFNSAFSSKSTSDLSEGTNLYYTNARVQAVSINNVVEDTTPQLGGNLDLNSSDITGTGDINITGTIQSSGNITGTLATAAQTNITSLGTLTALTVDDITINGSTISDGGDLTLDVAGDIILDADGGDIYLNDGGTGRGQISMANTDLTIISATSDRDLIFKGVDGASVITALTLDMSEAGDAFFNHFVTANRFYVPDNGLFIAGNGSDLKISCDGTHGLIESVTGDLTLDVQGDIILDPNGNVGIGTTSPQRPLHVNGTEGVLRLTSTASGNNGFEVGVGTSSQAFLWNAENSEIQIATNNAERMRITGAGAIEIKGTSTTTSAQGFITNNNSVLAIGSSVSGSVVKDISFNSPSTMMYIDGSTSRVGIGTTSPDGKLHIFQSDASITPDADADDFIIEGNGATGMTIGSSNSSVGSIRFADSGSSRAGMIYYNHVGNEMRFYTVASERMRITSAGKFVVGDTSALNGGGALGSFVFSGAQGVFISTVGQATGEVMGFVHQKTSVVGTIAINSSSTTYNTSSDARLKDVTGKARGLDVINKLNPVSYNWKADGRKDEGLIAQECEDIVPNAVTKNSSDYYGMDYSKLVVHLVKGMQEQQEQIQELKEEIQNLKG